MTYEVHRPTEMPAVPRHPGPGAPMNDGEAPGRRNPGERIEGVSCSLPYSALLALTSSHMFLSVMN